MDRIKYVHESGFVYNNIDLNNIVVEGNLSLDLINFEYMTKLGQPIDPNSLSNFTFKSINLLENPKTPTFKDDIISVFYLIIYLLCDRKHIALKGWLLSVDQMLEYRQRCSIYDLPSLMVDHVELFGFDQELLEQ